MMNRLIATLALVAFTWGLVGCDNSEKPKTDAEGKPAKAPETPPSGV